MLAGTVKKYSSPGSLLRMSSPSSPSSKTSTSSRCQKIANLQEWIEYSDIQVTKAVALRNTEDAGLGWFVAANKDLAVGDLLLTVPTDMALTVESPGSGPDDREVPIPTDKKTNLPWYAQMALYLYKLDKISDTKANVALYRPWLNSLPRDMLTPMHWTDTSNLQYEYLAQSVDRQRRLWKDYYEQVKSTRITWNEFCWGCEMARSRAFSGYSGSAFNPRIYAFTLLLVTAYVGLNLGTLEQAANGAGVVVAVSILKDFVIPKLFKKKRYVICPMIDMCNHKSTGANANVSFEFFGNAYSLAVSNPVTSNEQIFISYGDRSNDQLLQYYGFVEPDNPHDVYIMPPLREWDIRELEEACGRKFAPGRLQKLDRAGLLGSPTADTGVEGEEFEEAANVGGGVVLTRANGMDPAVLQALRALVSTDAEWEAAGQAIGNFATMVNPENEKASRVVARKAIEMELSSKATTLAQDKDMLKRMDAIKSLDAGPEDRVAVQFRIEKKKLLRETIEKLS